ncbi:hypothetical protein DPMN_148481 [Dreissena polymorpha]|uniref:Uncharacterized protein n=1 Tax=Dreissena polymorpha TaxID=45954 RepID=A0A9D4FE42_DREPO|nr:hypothetical protein DPMN_148481 [Dreissena polymorpha]
MKKVIEVLLKRSSSILNQQKTVHSTQKCLQKIHTSSGVDLQLGKTDDDVIYPDLPQVGVPNLQAEELLSFRGLETSFPCLTRK